MVVEAPDPLVALLAENQRYYRFAEMIDAQDSLAAFCARMDPAYEPSPHTALLVEHLEAVERGEIKRLAVFMPPRHSKTYHVSERFPAWFLGRHPERRVILASYGAELAEGSSRKVRNLIKDERWPFGGVGVAEDSSAVNRWATTAGGEVIAAGVGGAMTGFGADCFPAGTMVETEHGNMDIAHLTLLKSPPRVRSFNHETGLSEWRRVVAAREIWADALVEVATRGGRTSRSTPDHRYYVAGVGYVEAQRLQPGDRLVATPGAAGVRPVQHAVRATAVRLQQGAAARRDGLLLHQGVLEHDQESSRAAELLSALSGARAAQSSPDVLARMPASDQAGGQDEPSVSALRGGFHPEVEPTDLLHAGLCESSTCATDGGSRQLALQDWHELREVVRYDAPADSSARRRLCRVRRASPPRGPSPERAAGGQSAGESRDTLRALPRGAPQVEGDTVAVVARVRVPRVKVYDIQVEGPHNFFANGLLVHNCLIIDDPVKGRAEADSETYRASTWNWYTEVARTRLMPGGRIVVCQTRWHADDLAGRILKRPAGWTVLDLPALARADGDVLGRAPGEPLWPAWYDAAALDELRADLTSEQGARAWLALYQQRPTADEGGMFKRAWFAARYHEAPACELRILGVDSAFKAGVQNDQSALVLVGATASAFPVLDVVAGRWEYPELKRQIVAAAETHQPHAIAIEDTASGQSVIQELRLSTRLPIVPITVSASKAARAAAIAPMCEAGKVLLPNVSTWGGAFLDQLAAFPTGAHDDMVDAFVHALGYAIGAMANPREMRAYDAHLGSGGPASAEAAAFDRLRAMPQPARAR